MGAAFDTAPRCQRLVMEGNRARYVELIPAVAETLTSREEIAVVRAEAHELRKAGQISGDSWWKAGGKKGEGKNEVKGKGKNNWKAKGKNNWNNWNNGKGNKGKKGEESEK